MQVKDWNNTTLLTSTDETDYMVSDLSLPNYDSSPPVSFLWKDHHIKEIHMDMLWCLINCRINILIIIIIIIILPLILCRNKL